MTVQEPRYKSSSDALPVAGLSSPVVAESVSARLTLELRALRGSRSLTEVADVVGIRSDELGRIERGETKQMRFSTLLRLLEGLGIELHDLFKVERSTSIFPKDCQAALGAYQAGKLAPPRRRAVVRSESTDEQDLTHAAAMAEEHRDGARRRAIGTLNP